MRAAVFLALAMLSLAVSAQVYSWKDANGKVHYSDQPPANAGTPTRRVNTESALTVENTGAQQSAADKRMDAAKRNKEAAEQAAKAEKEKANDALRQQECERARIAYQGVESGRVRFRLSASGEREALEDNIREQELAELRRAVDTNCAPKPASSNAGSQKPTEKAK